jgi:hypothetical protein
MPLITAVKANNETCEQILVGCSAHASCQKYQCAPLTANPPELRLESMSSDKERFKEALQSRIQ